MLFLFRALAPPRNAVRLEEMIVRLIGDLVSCSGGAAVLGYLRSGFHPRKPTWRERAGEVVSLALDRSGVRCRRRVAGISPEAECYLVEYAVKSSY